MSASARRRGAEAALETGRQQAKITLRTLPSSASRNRKPAGKLIERCELGFEDLP